MAVARATVPKTSVRKQRNPLPSPDEIRRARQRRSAPPAREAVRAKQAHEPLLGACVARASHERHDFGAALRRENIGHDARMMQHAQRDENAKTIQLSCPRVTAHLRCVSMMSEHANGKSNGISPQNGARKRAAAAPRFRAASLFSGIGGFDLGLERAGFDITFQCELNKFCRSILKHRWPEIPHHENIKELTADTIPVSDVWAGGFPCQDVSLARMGARAGLRGKRSGLFHDFARLVGEARPRVVLLENVAGLLSSHRGRDFSTVIGTLAEFGYSVGWRVLNSKNFGVPQSRQRVYIVGCHRDVHGPGQILFESECREGNAVLSFVVSERHRTESWGGKN